jgi:hypothetical protein
MILLSDSTYNRKVHQISTRVGSLKMNLNLGRVGLGHNKFIDVELYI